MPRTSALLMAKVLGDFDRVDVLVNCGGVISKVPFQELTDEEWERTIRINLTGTFTMCSAIYPYFIEKKGGRIVNVSSVAGKIGGGLLGTGAYATSKAGVNGLTKVIAKEGGKYGISCNAVCPSLHHHPDDPDSPGGCREERQGHRHDPAGPSGGSLRARSDDPLLRLRCRQLCQRRDRRLRRRHCAGLTKGRTRLYHGKA